MPGVSKKTIWASGMVRTPWIAVRVVCGLSATIETFVPTNEFTSVDLPVLGRPSTETKPERKGWSGAVMVCGAGGSALLRHGLGLAEAHLFHPELVARQHLDADSVALHTRARLRDAAQPFADEPSDGGGFDLLLGMEVEEVAQPREVEIARDDVTPRAVLQHIRI